MSDLLDHLTSQVTNEDKRDRILGVAAVMTTLALLAVMIAGAVST